MGRGLGIRAMIKLRLRYVMEDVDRHGNVRTYFRRKGQPKLRLPGLPGSKEFMEAYQSALGDAVARAPKERGVVRGSFRYACIGYYSSPDFRGLDKSTQTWRRRVLDEIAQRHGHKPLALIQPAHIRKLRDEKADFPSAAQARLKALRALFKWAVEAGEAPHDPTRDVKALPIRSEGHHTWSEEEITKFEERYPLGTNARMAMALMLYTAGRREDAVRLGPQHVRDNRIRFRQAKNEHRKPVDLSIPIHDELAKAIAATNSKHLTFLVTPYGRPYTPAGFGNRFRDWCDEAGLPHCSAHGLRKAASVRLAEAGCSSHEIMSITGHRSLEEVERYTRAAQRSKLADAGMAKLKK